MKLKQLAAIIGLCVIGLLIAFGLSLLTPPPAEPVVTDQLDEETYKLVESEFKLQPGNSVVTRGHEGNFYFLEVYPNATEGGGFWALVKKTEGALVVIDSGNKSEYEMECAVLEAHMVPTSVQQYCSVGSDILDRVSGETTTQEALWEKEALNPSN